MRAARVHHAARRRGGGVAACGARAAGRADAADRRADGPCASDPEAQSRVAAFVHGLQELGWTTAATSDRVPLGRRQMPTALRRYAAELVALAPDVILANGTR